MRGKNAIRHAQNSSHQLKLPNSHADSFQGFQIIIPGHDIGCTPTQDKIWKYVVICRVKYTITFIRTFLITMPSALAN